MNYKAYHVVEPAADTDLWRGFEQLADAWSGRCARLLNAIDRFLTNGATPGYRVAPMKRGWRESPDRTEGVEVYLIPFIVGEAAALLRVDHGTCLVTFVAFYDNLGGYEDAAQWDQIIDMANDAAR